MTNTDQGTVQSGPYSGVNNTFTWWYIKWDRFSQAGYTAAQFLQLITPAPVISSVSPNPVTGVALPGRVNLTLTGTNFASGVSAFLTWTGGSATLSSANTTFVSSTQVNLSVATDAIADNWTVKVTNPDGKGSNTAGFQVIVNNPAPVISMVTPNSYPPLDGNQTMILSGSNFASGDTLSFVPPEGGTVPSNASKLTVNSGTQITYLFNNFNDSGNWSVTVNSPDGTKHSNAKSFTVPIDVGVTRKGVDYSFSHPSPTGLKAAGYNFPVRYVGGSGAPHDITADEASALKNAGVDIIVVFESTTGRMQAGYSAGVADANAAVTVAKAAGAPDNFFCYFACYFDASLNDQDAINAYLDGAASVLGGVNRVGFYGGYYPLKRVLDGGKASKGWQTAAWSNGNKDPRLKLYQRAGEVSIAGGTCDIDDAYADDLGQWSGLTPPPAPSISTVAPSPVNGSNSAQPLTIHGNNFVSGCNVTLRDLSTNLTFANHPVTSITATQIVVKRNFTTAGHTWSVEVINPDLQSTGQFNFQVVAPAVLPSISDVSPNPVDGSNAAQPFTIYGTNFVTGCSVTLRDVTASQIFTNRLISSFGPTQLVIHTNFTTSAHNWTVEVINPGNKSSGPFAFSVATPAQLRPDFIPSAVTPSAASFEAGTAATVNWVMTNQGPGNASNSATQLRLSQSAAAIGAYDSLLGTVTTVPIPAGGAVQQAATVTIPPSTPPGTYYVWVVATNVPNEGNTSNNSTYSAAIAVTLPSQPQQSPSVANIAPSPIRGSTRLQNIRLSGSNFKRGFKVRLQNVTTGKITNRTGTFVSNNAISVSMIFGPLASDWTATVINPDGKSAGAFPFNVIDRADGFNLAFPLAAPLNAYNAPISSVFDHAMTQQYRPGTDPSDPAWGVITFTDEDGTVQDPTDPVILKGSPPLYSYKKADGSDFSVNGQYVGTSSNKASLNYDGHSGYDYPTVGGTDVFASAGGKLYWINDDFNSIYIDHANGYRTFYLHCKSRLVTSGKSVQAGALIAKSGAIGANGSFHLHFHVRKLINSKWVLVDPYGWESPTGAGDPYVVSGVTTIDSINVRLWVP